MSIIIFKVLEFYYYKKLFLTLGSFYNIIVTINSKITMEHVLIEYAIFLFCLIGCGLQSYFSGRKIGVLACMEYLEEEGYLEFEDEDE